MVERHSGLFEVPPNADAPGRSAAVTGEDRVVSAAVVTEASKEPPPAAALGLEIVAAHSEQRPPVSGADEHDRHSRSPVGHMLERPMSSQLASSRLRRDAAAPVLRVLPDRCDRGIVT